MACSVLEFWAIYWAGGGNTPLVLTGLNCAEHKAMSSMFSKTFLDKGNTTLPEPLKNISHVLFIDGVAQIYRTCKQTPMLRIRAKDLAFSWGTWMYFLKNKCLSFILFSSSLAAVPLPYCNGLRTSECRKFARGLPLILPVGVDVVCRAKKLSWDNIPKTVNLVNDKEKR